MRSDQAAYYFNVTPLTQSSGHFRVVDFLEFRIFSLFMDPQPPAPFGSAGLPFEGVRCFYFNILGIHFGTSGPPWEAILAPRDRPGGPWEQQDGFEVVVRQDFI